MRRCSKLIVGVLFVFIWLTACASAASWAAEPVGGSISGVVLDENNTPIPNADVWADPWGGGEGIGTKTNGQGEYTITMLAADQYRVAAQADGKVRKYYNNTLDYNEATAVQVEDGSTITGVDFKLEAGGSISGVVKDKDGNLLEGISVGCGRTDGEGGSGTITAADGTYTITGLALGRYKVNAPAQGGPNDAIWIRQFYNGKSQYSEADEVDISTAPNAIGINFNLTQGGSISGVVKDDNNQVIPDADVWAEPWNGGDGNGTRTNAQGQYTITGVSSGDYRVGAKADGHVMKFYDNTLDHGSAAKVVVNDGAAIANIDFSLEAGGSISGVVKDKNGNLLEGISVGCGRTDGPGGSGTITAADGTYTITGLALGKYKVNAPAQGGPNDANWISQFYNGKSQYSDADEVDISTAPNAVGINFNLTQGGSISGVVKDDQNQLIPNADVWADPWNGGEGKGTQTDSQGQYTITGLIGDFRVGAQADGHVMKFYNNTLDHGNAAKVTVNDGAAIVNIDFSLEAGGSISGTIIGPDNAPLAGIGVGCGRTDGQGGNRTTTDQNGNYTLRSLAFGSYIIQAAGGWGDNDKDWARQFYNGKTLDSEADLVQVLEAAPNQSGKNFKLTKGGSISGVVKDDQNQVIPYADVWAEPWNGGEGKGTQTDSQGQYTITGLIGDYRVGSQANGHIMKFYNNTLDHSSAAKVTINDGAAILNIDFSLEAGGSISGTIIGPNDEPLAGIGVSCGRTDGQGGNRTTTDQNGNYTLRSLAFGSYIIQAAGGWGDNDKDWAKQFYNGKTLGSEADLVQVLEAAPNQSGKNFRLRVGGSISGVVKDDSGAAIPNADVWAENCNGDWVGGDQTDASGQYAIAHLGTGQYLVGAQANGHVMKFYNNTLDHGSAAAIQVNDGQTTANINFSLEAGGTISGVVKDQDGNPLGGIGIGCGRTDGIGGGRIISEADGTFTLRGLAFGSYNIQAAGGWGENDDYYLIQYYNGKTLATEADLVSVGTGTPNQTGINFILIKAGCISGTVTDELGKPVKNIEVQAEPWDGGNAIGTLTDEQGRFKITKLPEGQYRVVVIVSAQEKMYYKNTKNYAEATAVTVVAQQNTQNINFKISSQNCFIATAAYGSYLDPHIQVLRNFRDKVLLQSAVGRWFVVQYYKYSPPLAAMIARHEGLRFMVRILLTPVIFMVAFPKASGFVLFVLLLIMLLIISKRHRVQRQAIV